MPETYTLKAVHPDYDIVITYEPGLMQGCDVLSVLRLADRQYKHVQSNEASSSNFNARDKEGYIGEEAYLRDWRTKKRAEVISGAINFKQVGPRMSAEDKEWFRLIDEFLQEKFAAAGITPYPTSGKAIIQGKSLNEWRTAYKNSPKFAHFGVTAKANVEATRQKVAEAKKTVTQGQVNFDDLEEAAE